MDHYNNTGTDQGMISDAPALWFLNAAIPRILQYGNDRNNIPCSCWSTGCGEFDAFEVLSNGQEKAKSTLHRQNNLEGGDSNYFKRPVGSTLKFAVVWNYPNIIALVLDDSFDFGSTLSDDQVQSLVSYDPNSWVHSLFAIGD
ncbi:target of Sbf [Neocucurbitaria cava]|uniref:Target of Sbf n=1 Tax=Neocucurbitaria cava TaxID=798079 RepID=A0A9W8YAI1_9PLEO|nr:target of Sbf [Neocucurbitaria cava]